MWVSFLIYAIAGGLANQHKYFIDGMVTGLYVAAIDSTIGWWVSWVIGPGRLPDTVPKETRPKAIINAISLTIFTGIIFGLLGAIVKSIFFS